MSVLASESFVGTNASPIGGNWTSFLVGGATAGIDRTSNEAIGHLGGNGGAYFNTVTPPNDQYAKAVVGGSTGGYHAAVARIDTASETYYAAFWTGGTGYILKYIAGVQTVLNSTSSTLATNDVTEIRCIGTTITSWLNGAQLLTATDSAIASGRFGIWLNAGTYKSFEGGDFAGAAFLGRQFYEMIGRAH